MSDGSSLSDIVGGDRVKSSRSRRYPPRDPTSGGRRCIILDDSEYIRGAKMAERLVRQLIDDLDRTEISDGGGERIEFGLRNVRYCIDLSNANIAKFEKALAPYVKAATRMAAQPRRGAATGSRLKGSKSARKVSPRNGRQVRRSGIEDFGAIRVWARENGYAVSERGRIAATVIEAFRAAHGS